MHENHRSRLKKRFIAEGLDSFEDHNKLELLLFYALPRCDTNEIAHDLINNFGSLRNVFDAEISELVKISGISEHSAILIKMIPALARHYIKYDDLADEIYDSIEKIGQYFIRRYVGITTETVMIMLLDNSNRLIKYVDAGQGIINSTDVPIRKIVQSALDNNASSVVLAHNHPNGTTVPSNDDINATFKLSDILDSLGITLLEHIVVAGNDFRPIVNSMMFNVSDI